MPEGDTIYRAARALAKALEGKTVTAFDTGFAHLARIHDDAPIPGRTVEKVEPRGKWLLIRFSGDLILVSHMLMSGSWHIYRSGEKWWMARSKMRVVLEVEGFQAVLFNAQIAEFHTQRSLERHTQIPQLGPDILSAAFTPQSGIDALRKHARENPTAEVGVTLLNQRVMAGLGNVYKSEIPFSAGVNPFRPIATLSEKEIEHIADLSQRYMQLNVSPEAPGKRQTTGSMDREERLWVYGRRGEECRRCGTLIQMRKQGEQARSTYWCPTCQPFAEAPSGNATRPRKRYRPTC
ncbi:DNA-(apurinic or apyrimidinic site) lyase /endonuclease VIII [Granulicella pectinivorans]|jgi:endonuclease-8|uniref:DNA-(apurinic or apyrimidinic site) lyase n=1 Tax=Granulicella pectinivorans TaxID=474950 RepID=A0A1I6M2C2_9BACT|nr:DNA-formamidopyrimidine glycosylase family protein [Granulicella pectinivorans]SFS09784.1 DNA-(apurinic or apyrimidinic site) lyase /endonuclease VIII [Granulicella pectinivorans]